MWAFDQELPLQRQVRRKGQIYLNVKSLETLSHINPNARVKPLPTTARQGSKAVMFERIFERTYPRTHSVTLKFKPNGRSVVKILLSLLFASMAVYYVHIIIILLQSIT